MITIRALVEALGGGSAVAKRLGVSPSAVSLWVTNDRVPPARAIDMWRMARDAGHDWCPPGAEDLTLAKREAA